MTELRSDANTLESIATRLREQAELRRDAKPIEWLALLYIADQLVRLATQIREIDDR